MRDLVYYVATSIDGFIADPDGDFSAFPNNPATLSALFNRYPETCPAHIREALGVSAPPRRFDTVLMGYHTYAPARAAGLPGGAYPHLSQIVATHRAVPESPTLTTITGALPDRVAQLKNEPGQDIWLCGGASLAAQVVDLIDEIQIKVNPIVLGAGIPMLPASDLQHLQLAASDELPGGVMLLTYRTH